MQEEEEIMWKIQYAWRKGSVSSSESRYFEDEEEFKACLFRKMLDANSGMESPWMRKDNAAWRRFRSWALFFRRRAGTEDSHATKIIYVGRYENDKWVELKADLTPPELSVYDA